MKEKENTCSLHKSHNIDTSIDSNKLLSYQVQFNCKFPFNKASTIIIVHVNDNTILQYKQCKQYSQQK